MSLRISCFSMRYVLTYITNHSVVVGAEIDAAKLSARNILSGSVTKIIEGPVNTEVDIEIGTGNTISAVITHGSSVKMGLTVGSKASAIFKASSVILGVN